MDGRTGRSATISQLGRFAVPVVVCALALAGCTSAPTAAEPGKIGSGGHATAAHTAAAGSPKVGLPESTKASATAGSSTPAGSSSAAGYQRYANDRFGFACQVPADFASGAEPADGDGLTFSAGEVRVTCSGANNPGGQTAQQAFDDAQATATDEGGSVTYQHIDGDTFTVSGLDRDGNIYYEHTIWGAGSSVTVAWVYPAAQKAALDDAVTRSATTLQPGDLSSAH